MGTSVVDGEEGLVAPKSGSWTPGLQRDDSPLVWRCSSAPRRESRCRANSASALLVAARTMAILCGTTMSSPPVTSSTPSKAPEVGS